MNPLVSDFLRNVLTQIKCKKVHPYIVHELEDHIELLKEDYIEEGLSEETAYQKAVKQMGDATLIGKELHQAHKPRLEWSILLLIIALLSVGVFVLWIWGECCKDYGYGQNLFKRQIEFILLGGVGFWIAYFIDYRRFERWSLVGFVVSLILMLGTSFYGITINGVTRWLMVGPIAIQASKLAIFLLLFSYIGIIRKWGSDKVRDYFILGTVAQIPIFIMSMQNLQEAVLLEIVFVLILTFYITHKSFKGNRIKFLSILYGTTTIGIGSASFLWLYRGGYRMDRLKAFLNPELDPRGSGYQYMVIKNIRESASFIGGLDMEKVVGYLPTDGASQEFVLTVIIASLGWFAAMVVVLMIALIIIRLFKASLKVQEAYGRLICLTISSLFTARFILNILINLGYFPLTGCTLPFISYGGSALVIDIIMMGTFLGVYRNKDIVLEATAKQN